MDQLINLRNLLRHYDFKGFDYLYQKGVDDSSYYMFFYFFAKYGIVLFFLTFTYLIWKKKIRAFFCSFLAMGIAGFFDYAIYIFWKRPRPFATYSDFIQPDTFGLRVDGTSFPSSHTYIVFAIATSVFLYGHKKLGTVLFALAVLVAIGRIGTGLHYPSDTIGGAIIGIISGIIAYKIVSKGQKNWRKPAQ